MLPKVVENALVKIEDNGQRLKDYKIIGQENSTTVVLRFRMDILHTSDQDRVTPLLHHRSPVLLSRDKSRLQGWLGRQTSDCLCGSQCDHEVNTCQGNWTFQDSKDIYKPNDSCSELVVGSTPACNTRPVLLTSETQTELHTDNKVLVEVGVQSEDIISDAVDIGVQCEGIKLHSVGVQSRKVKLAHVGINYHAPKVICKNHHTQTLQPTSQSKGVNAYLCSGHRHDTNRSSRGREIN